MNNVHINLYSLLTGSAVGENSAFILLFRRFHLLYDERTYTHYEAIMSLQHLRRTFKATVPNARWIAFSVTPKTNTVKQWPIVRCDLPLRLASSNTPVTIHVVFTLLTKVELKQSRSVFALPVSGENYVSNVRDGFYARRSPCRPIPDAPPP